MSTLNQVREGLSEVWDSLMDGWQRLYRRAAGAITRFTPTKYVGKEGEAEAAREVATRSIGWGVLAAELFDDDEKIVVRVEAPGMEKSDFDLEVADDYLVIRGEKQIGREHTEGQYHITECAYGSFERAIPLPDDVQADAARASYTNGVLRIELPKPSTRRRKRVSVSVS